MMGIDADIAALIAVGRLVAMIDKQHRIGVRKRLRSHDGHLGAAILVRYEIIGRAGAIEWRKSNGLLVEVILEQAVMTVRP